MISASLSSGAFLYSDKIFKKIRKIFGEMKNSATFVVNNKAMDRYISLHTTIPAIQNGIPFMIKCANENPLYEFIDSSSIITTECGDKVILVTMKLKPAYKRIFLNIKNKSWAERLNLKKRK